MVEGLAPGDSVGVGLLDSEGVEVREGLAPVEREGVGVSVGLLVSVEVEVIEGLEPGARVGVGV